MPKRKNPFGDSAPIQLKTHVGFRQCATEEERKNVYEKTMALLFQGANPHLKKIPGVFAVNGTLNGCNGQTTTLNGHCTPLEGEKNGGMDKQESVKVDRCVSCVKHPASEHFACSHCLRHVCSPGCLRACSVCDMPYCHYCSVLRYDNEVRAVCFDCLPLNS